MVFPLRGVRVLDMSQAIAGPYVGRILADLGADVVKIDWPRGDVSGHFGEKVGGVSGLFNQMNAGKRGLAIDHRVEAGADLIRRLGERADVVIENFRPGTIDESPYSYASLSRENPGLVMLSISGFGRNGPESDRQAYAAVLHAESGLIARQAQVDGDRPTDLAFALADSVTALHGAVAVLAAVHLRSATGTGQHIDLAMIDAMVATDDYIHYSIDEQYDIYAPRGDVWDAPGGPLVIGSDAKTVWAKISKHAGVEDPAPGADVEAKIAARRAAIADWIMGFTDRADLIRSLEAADLPWADVRTTATVLASPTLQARNVVAKVDNGIGGVRGVIRMPYQFSAGQSDVQGPPPRPGCSDVEVLGEWLDMSSDELQSLQRSGALF